MQRLTASAPGLRGRWTMQTNREWLFSLPLDELYEWFDAPHANDALGEEKVVSSDSVDSSNAKAPQDER